jgi:ribosome-associated protein
MKNNLALALRHESDSLKFAERVVTACEDVKGQDIAVLDVRAVSDFADYFVVVTGRSDRQVQGLTNRIIEDLIASGLRPLSVEGYEEGQWVLVDCGDIVVHIFYEPVRDFYDIESLWMRAPKVRVRGAA